ncbi:MAG: GEVED domain-containing protein, partial [Pirellulales bacterium]
MSWLWSGKRTRRKLKKNRRPHLGAKPLGIESLEDRRVLVPLLVAGDGGVSLDVGSGGEFSSAIFNPVGAIPAADTVFDSYLAIGVPGGPRTAIAPAAPLVGDTTSTASQFNVLGLDTLLVQTVDQLFEDNANRVNPTGSILFQTYRFFNNTAEPIAGDVVRYLDGDLNFAGGLADSGGTTVINENDADPDNDMRVMFETDQQLGGDGANTFVGITLTGGDLAPNDSGHFALIQWNGLQPIIAGGAVLPNAIEGDLTGDGFTNGSFDVTVGLRQTFSLDPGEITVINSLTLFGDLPDGDIDLPEPPEAPSISGVKFEDRNNNGARDAGESGLSGWTIFIDANSNEMLDADETSVVTAAGGGYTIPVVPGTFTVREIPQEGYLQTFPGDAANFEHTVTVDFDMPATDVDFGNVEPQISGIKYHDIDGDGVFNLGDYGLANWTVYLDLDNDGVLDDGEPSQQTNLLGRYKFTELSPGGPAAGDGLMSIQVINTDGPDPGNDTGNWLNVWNSLDGGAGPTGNVAGFGIQFNTSDTETVFDYPGGGGDFGINTAIGTINNDGPGGGNGPFEPGGPGGVNYSIRSRAFLAFNTGGTYTIAMGSNDGRRIELTDATPGGSAVFNGFSARGGQVNGGFNPGDTVIGYSAGTFHNQSVGTFAVAAGDILELDAFYYQGIGTDSGEISIASGTQGSFNGNFQLLADGVLNIGLDSARAGLPPTSFTVREVNQNGWVQFQGADGYAVNYNVGDVVTGLDFGNQQFGGITGFKWHDLNENGNVDSGEPRLSGWEIFHDANGNGNKDTNELSTLTAVDGSFSFAEIAPGNYRIAEVLQPNWKQTYPANGFHDVTVVGGEVSNDVNFGNRAFSFVRGMVFNDANNNGFHNSGEGGLAGEYVYADANFDGAPNLNEVGGFTDSNGQFELLVAPASYDIKTAPNAGFVVTTPEPVSITIAAGEEISGLVIGKNSRIDFGDAPETGFSYPTTLANNGARHDILAGFGLGAIAAGTLGVDGEPDGQPTLDAGISAAAGDDGNGSDDEDGVAFTTNLRPGSLATIAFTGSAAQNVVQGKVQGFIDFNRDGDWKDDGEQIFADVVIQSGTPAANSLTFTVPADAAVGPTYARFRISTEAGISDEGPARDGEVEDYLVAILPQTSSLDATYV